MKISCLILITVCICWWGCTHQQRSTAHVCTSVELRWSLTDTSPRGPEKQLTAISPCHNRSFSDRSGRIWKTDAQGHIYITKLPEEWILWPTPSSSMLDAFVAHWLFDHGHHYLAARQWLSLLLMVPSDPILPHFCVWWEVLRQDGAQWERMMKMLPLVAMHNERTLIAASPRHGFLLRLPASVRVRENSLDASTSLWVITQPNDEQNPLLLLISSEKPLSVEDVLGLPRNIAWNLESDGRKTATIEGKTWVRRDESAFGHHHIWITTSSMRSKLDWFDTLESFSFIDPCSSTAEPLPEPKS